MSPEASFARHVVVREIDRATAATVDALGPIGTATVHEAIGRRGYLGAELRPIQQDIRIAGSAVTVLSHPGDNMMLHAAVEVCQPRRCAGGCDHGTVDPRHVWRSSCDLADGAGRARSRDRRCGA